MVFLGFIPKRRVFGRDVNLPSVDEVCSVSACISLPAPDADWSFNRASCYATVEEAREKIPTGEEAAFRVFGWWLISGSAEPFDASLPSLPETPADLQVTVLGFDVVGRYLATQFDHSPLSCNGLAAEWPVNRWCLFDTEAQALEAARQFDERPPEPGPYVVVRVDSVDDPVPDDGRKPLI